MRYYDIKNALTKDNFDSAKASVSRFSSALTTISTDPTLADLLKKLSRESKQMASAHDIEAMRKAFKSVSNDMTTLVSRYHANGSDAAYLQFCPMVKAYWISAEQEVRNPYYGKKMLFCGQSMKSFN
jgi:hypothetical protein